MLTFVCALTAAVLILLAVLSRAFGQDEAVMGERWPGGYVGAAMFGLLAVGQAVVAWSMNR